MQYIFVFYLYKYTESTFSAEYYSILVEAVTIE